jgi:sn-glycerol 3-phosphate transport system substrate-binding protein
MNITKFLGTVALAAGLSGITASIASAADLTFYFPIGVDAPAAKTIDEMTKAWAAQNPGDTIKAVYGGDYEQTMTKALTAAKAGTPPTVAVLLTTDLFTLAEEGVVTPISEIATSAEDKAWLDSFYKGFTRDTILDGKVYSVPFQRSTAIMLYNKDAFRKAGLDPNKPPKTWDDVIKMGKKLTRKDASGNVVQWGTRLPNLALGGAWVYFGLVHAAGGDLAADNGVDTYLDSPAAVAALKYELKLAAEGVEQPGGIAWGDTPKAFISGNAATIWTSTGNLAFVKQNATFDWGAAFLPGEKGPGTTVGGGNLYVFKNISPEQRKAALSFVKFMTSPENAAKWSIATGYVAPRADAWDTPEMKEYAKTLPAALVARDQIQYAGREFATYQRQRVTQFLTDAIESSVAGKTKPEAALKEAQKQAEQVLSSYK